MSKIEEIEKLLYATGNELGFYFIFDLIIDEK